jgi:hypothetical protein
MSWWRSILVYAVAVYAGVVFALADGSSTTLEFEKFLYDNHD